MMNNKNIINKQKIVFLILESDKNSTEKVYFELLNKKAKENLKYEIIYKKIGQKISKNKILEIKNIKNIKEIVLVKDNDTQEYSEQNILEDIKEIEKILNLNTETLKSREIKRYGIPTQGKTFDLFLLAHFEKEIFKKNKTKSKSEKKLKDLLDEDYKGSNEKIQKVFKQNYLENLESNLKNFDE